MSGTAITSQNTAEAIPKLIAAQALPALVGRLVMALLVNRAYENQLQAMGDTVNVPVPPTLVANNISEGGTVTLQNPSLGNAQIVLNAHREASFQIPDITRTFAAVDLLSVYTEPGIIGLATQIETDLLAAYPYLTYNATLGGASTITEATIDTAETNLFTALVPPGMPMNLIVAPSTFSSMRQISRFTEYQTTGKNQGNAIVGTGLAMADGAALDLPMRTNGPGGADGTIKGFNVYRSQYVTKVSSTNQNIAFAKDALTMVMRQLPKAQPGLGVIQQTFEYGGFNMRVTLSYQSNVLGEQVTIDVLYGIAALRQQFGQLIQAT